MNIAVLILPGPQQLGLVLGLQYQSVSGALQPGGLLQYVDQQDRETAAATEKLAKEMTGRMEKLFAAVDHDNYGLLIDVGNFACVDEDSVKAVSRLANYAVHVHAKDFVKKAFGTPDVEGERYLTTRGCNKLVACAIGDGDIPVAQCMAILRKAGYDRYVTIEFEGAEDCLQAIARGRENLMRYLGR